MAATGLVVGLDIGGTKLNAGLVRADGTVVHQIRRPTPAADGGEAIFAAVVSVIAEVLAAVSEPVHAIGVGSPGHIDFASGIVTYCTPNLTGWSGMPLVGRITEHFGLPAVADNDANAALYGEIWQGAARGCDHAVLLTLGTGVGGGLLSHGQMIRGARGGAAELGHMIIAIDGRPCNCGQRGCLEAYASGSAIGALARERLADGVTSRILGLAGSVEAVTAHHVFAALHEGDSLAAGVMAALADHLAIGIVTLINVFQPQRVLIGGGVAEQGDALLQPVRQAVRRRYCQAPLAEDLIVLATLGGEAGLLGAAGLAWHHAVLRRRETLEPHHA